MPTCWCHPDAYLNKLLVGAADGRLALVNFVTGAVVHVFPGFGGAAVRCVCGSPALDVVAVGLADGRCVLHNIRVDDTLAIFTHDTAKGAVSAVSFRTGAGTPMVAVGGADGTISVWDLNTQRVHSLVKEAHDAPVRVRVRFGGACFPPLLRAGRCGHSTEVADLWHMTSPARGRAQAACGALNHDYNSLSLRLAAMAGIKDSVGMRLRTGFH